MIYVQALTSARRGPLASQDIFLCEVGASCLRQDGRRAKLVAISYKLDLHKHIKTLGAITMPRLLLA